MLTAFLMLTDKCNLNCSFCFNKILPRNKRQSTLKKSEWLKVIDILSSNKVSNIIFTGGEPLLLKNDIYPLIEKANEKKIQTLLLTNSIDLDKISLQNLKDSNLGFLTLSLNELTDLDPDVREKFFYFNLDKYKEKIEESLKYFDTITITLLLSNKNYKYIHKLYSFFDNEKVFIIFQPVFDNKLGLYNLTEDEWKELKLQLSDWTIKYNKFNYVQMIYNLFNNIKFNPPDCLMGTYSFVIDWYGDVYTCFHKLNQYNGNILKDEPNKIFINLINNSSESLEGTCFGLHCISLFLNQL